MINVFYWQKGESIKSSPRWALCKLWVCFFGWELEGIGAVTQEILHLTSTTSTTSKLSSKARLPYPCITAYAMTPSLKAVYIHAHVKLENQTSRKEQGSNLLKNAFSLKDLFVRSSSNKCLWIYLCLLFPS